MGKYDGALDEWNRYKDRKEQWEDLQNVIPEYEPPPDHLWNIPGTDIWVTPNEPVEPGDCEKWPASCEHIFDPLNPQDNHSLSPGLDFETSYSECSVCITITPNLGPISLPPYTVCRIKEECQEPKEAPEEGEFLPDPEVPNLPDYYEYPTRDYDYWIECYGGESFASGDTSIPFGLGGGGEFPARTTQTLTDWMPRATYLKVPANWKCILKKIQGVDRQPNYYTFVSIGYYFYVYPLEETSNFLANPQLYLRRFRLSQTGQRDLVLERPVIQSLTVVEVGKYFSGFFSSFLSEYGTPVYSPAPTFLIPTPDPQIMPSCCDLDSVLAAIKKLKKSVDRIEKVIAPQEFYEIKRDGSLGRNICSIPKRFMYPLSSGQQPVKNYAELIEFLMRQVDRNNGASSWEVVIEDSDPSTPGDQKLPIQVHSLNDGLKAILQFLIDQATAKNGLPALTFENVMWNQKALVCMGYDLASVKKMMVIDNHILQNIEDHMDYKVEQKEIQVPFGVNPVLNNFSHEWKNTAIMKNLFNPKKHTVVVTENIDKIGLGETLNQIGRNAAIAASPQVQKYDDNIIDKLVDAAQTDLRLTNAVLLSEMKKQLGVMDDEDTKKWIEDAEKAYNPSGGNQENDQRNNQQEETVKGKYYGNKKPASIVNTTKRSRRKRRHQNG